MRTTSDSSATREICTGNLTWKRRHLSVKEPWIQELRRKNESQLVSEDTTTNMANTETEMHMSERLTRERYHHAGERGTMTEGKTPREPRRSEREDCGERNDTESCNELL